MRCCKFEYQGIATQQIHEHSICSYLQGRYWRSWGYPTPSVPLHRLLSSELRKRRWRTIDWEKDWKRHADPHRKHNHHHPEISKEEIAILHVNFAAKNTYQSRFVDDEWIWRFEKWHNPSKLCHGKWFGTFPTIQPSYSGQMNLLFRYSSNERSRFIDSLVLFPELKNREVSTFLTWKRRVVHTKRNPTKKARKIKPLITNDQRNADTELPELVVLVAISLLLNPTRRKTLWEIGMGALLWPWLLNLTGGKIWWI